MFDCIYVCVCVYLKREHTECSSTLKFRANKSVCIICSISATSRRPWNLISLIQSYFLFSEYSENILAHQVWGTWTKGILWPPMRSCISPLCNIFIVVAISFACFPGQATLLSPGFLIKLFPVHDLFLDSCFILSFIRSISFISPPCVIGLECTMIFPALSLYCLYDSHHKEPCS